MIIVVTLPDGIAENQAERIVRQLSSSGAPIKSVALYSGAADFVAEQQLGRSAPGPGVAPMPMGGAGAQHQQGAATGRQNQPAEVWLNP